ncbi:MAG: hypothetical protein ACRDKZ_02445 [Actinomycetota bacterium]
MWLDALRETLDNASEPVDFFFRDDDVGRRDDRLWALLDLFRDRALPVDLAVIPNELGPLPARELGARVADDAQRIGVHQHGLAHANHEPGGRKFEFGPSRDLSQQRHDISRGRRRLEDLLGSAVQPIFTPPWNRCTAVTGQCLVELGFRVLSREWRAARLSRPDLQELPVRVDWFAHRKQVRLTRSEFGALLADSVGGPGPTGIMFHHAVMDRDERSAAGCLLQLLADHPRARVHSMLTLAEAGALPAPIVGVRPGRRS